MENEENIILKGVVKSSFVDYPGKICAVVFLSRCNFRCSFCYNPELVFDNSKVSSVPVNEFMGFLDERKKWIDGVCITGGEPTLHKGLADFMKMIKDKGLLVKLDTNGTNPALVEYLIKNKLVDYIAMDIKAGEENYPKATNVKVDMDSVKRSIALLKENGKLGNVDYEFRTTIYPGIFDRKELMSILELIKGSKRYYLQQFKPDYDTVGEVSRKVYSGESVESFIKLAKPHFETCEARGNNPDHVHHDSA